MKTGEKISRKVQRMKKNRGFTLIELIVVMAIAGIVAIGTMVGYHLIDSGSARSTVERINAMLDYVRLENMSKSEPYYLDIVQEEGDYYLKVEKVFPTGSSQTVLKEKMPLKKGGEITFQNNTEDIQYLVSSESVEGRDVREKLEVGFSKNTGGFVPSREGEIITKIDVRALGRDSAIHLVEITGKHYTQ
jgi:prepilin-type N-terminal cleavage/methylation domain-containing protein